MDSNEDQGRDHHTSHLASSLWRHGRPCPVSCVLRGSSSCLTPLSLVALAMGMRPVIWAANHDGVSAPVQSDSQRKVCAVFICQMSLTPLGYIRSIKRLLQNIAEASLIPG
jgi:hypothetical protein